jgi:multidrug efflux pump subunit AcrA (membrane-fusion protein)
VSAGQLLAYLDRSWDARDRARAQLKDRLPALQQRARRTHRLLLELLGLPVVEPACA